MLYLPASYIYILYLPMTQLQLLIVAYGRKGIESVATLPHPEVEGVEYIVSWQYGDDPAIIPEELLQRNDFKVYLSDTRGVTRNRNLALQKATAPIALLSDDDVYYTAEQLQDVIETFREYPDADYINFAYHSDEYPLPRPDHFIDINRYRKWFDIGGAFEMAFRLQPIRRHNIRFNELFGIGHEFPSGEEGCFLHDVLEAGLKAIYVPKVIVTHPGSTTCMRDGLDASFIRTKGAQFTIIHPYTWFLRLITHVIRFDSSISGRIDYIKAWLKGHRDYKRLIRQQKKR